MSNGEVQPVPAQPQPVVIQQAAGVPWGMLCVVALAIVGMWKGPEIIKAWKGGGDSPAPAPVSGKLFPDRHCADYFAAAASQVAKIIKDDGESSKPRLTKVEDVLETMAGALCRSTLLGELHDVDKVALARFVTGGLQSVGDKAGPLTPELRAKVVAAWEQVAKDSATQVR